MAPGDARAGLCGRRRGHTGAGGRAWGGTPCFWCSLPVLPHPASLLSPAFPEQNQLTGKWRHNSREVSYGPPGASSPRPRVPEPDPSSWVGWVGAKFPGSDSWFLTICLARNGPAMNTCERRRDKRRREGMMTGRSGHGRALSLASLPRYLANLCKDALPLTITAVTSFTGSH